MIWHLIPRSLWLSEPGSAYVPLPPGFAADGFVHASPDEPTVLAVARAYFGAAGEPVLALAVDERLLSAPVRWEAADPAPPPGVPAGTLFPHVYGPVDRAAVTGIRYLRRDPAGRYTALEPADRFALRGAGPGDRLPAARRGGGVGHPHVPAAAAGRVADR